MSTIVCQNLFSCFESHLADTTAAATLKLKVAPLDDDDHEFGNWGFLQQTINSKESDCIYTHPFSMSSKLSPKSLELCTENLGSESGSDAFSDCSSIFSASPPLSPTSNSRQLLNDWNPKKTTPEHAHAKGACRNFPPPLTTMSGSTSLQVRRHRQGGRLIIEAVEGPFRNSYLQAERSDGRLKLCFTTARQEPEEEEKGDECSAAEEDIKEPRNELEPEMEELEGEINVMEKFQRPSRCKQGGPGNKGLCNNWKPALWVATS